MKKPAARPRTARRRVADRQVAELQRRDLGSDVPATARVLRRARPTSIVLEPDLVDRLRVIGAKRGLGHQKTLEVIVRARGGREPRGELLRLSRQAKHALVRRLRRYVRQHTKACAVRHGPGDPVRHSG